MTSVEFVKLERPERAAVLCELADEFLLQGKRVLVVVQDENQGVTLDRFMWTWRKGAFVPHVYDNGAVECIDEPVVISTREEISNGARVLVQGRPCSLEFLRHFERVIDFAELYDEQLRQDARDRYKACQKAGFDVGMR